MAVILCVRVCICILYLGLSVMCMIRSVICLSVSLYIFVCLFLCICMCTCNRLGVCAKVWTRVYLVYLQQLFRNVLMELHFCSYMNLTFLYVVGKINNPLFCKTSNNFVKFQKSKQVH